MKIKGIDGMSAQELHEDVALGGKFVIYTYCISIIVLTFKRPSSITYVASNQNRVAKGLPYLFTSLVLGWWGIPWGIIYTIGAIGTNIGGGKNVTNEVMDFVMKQYQGPVFDFEKDVTADEEKQLEHLKQGVSNE